MIPLPNKKYNIIYADPPWGYQNKATRAAAEKHYGTMTIDDLKKMKIGTEGGDRSGRLRALYVGDLPYAKRSAGAYRGVGLQV